MARLFHLFGFYFHCDYYLNKNEKKYIFKLITYYLFMRSNGVQDLFCKRDLKVSYMHMQL